VDWAGSLLEVFHTVVNGGDDRRYSQQDALTDSRCGCEALHVPEHDLVGYRQASFPTRNGFHLDFSHWCFEASLEAIAKAMFPISTRKSVNERKYFPKETKLLIFISTKK
jgi:hypothetical protein